MKRVAALSAVAAFALGACGNGDGPDASPPMAAPQACPNELPFAAGHVPPGIQPDAIEGPGGGAADLPGVVQFHYAGPPGTFVDVKRGVVSPPSPESETIEILGDRAVFYTIEDGWGAQFRLGPNDCDIYELSGYGLDGDDIRAFAEGLEPRPR